MEFLPVAWMPVQLSADQPTEGTGILLFTSAVMCVALVQENMPRPSYPIVKV